jgi:hypothetical protein
MSGLSVGSNFAVTMEFTRDALQVLMKNATDVQARAETHFKFQYETVLVGETHWWEEPDTPLPDLPPPSSR